MKKKEEPQLIHHLIAFPTEYFTACKRANEIGELNDPKAWLDFRETILYNTYVSGGTYRGSYDDKATLIARILASKDVYDICEGWYDYLLIESYYKNCIDGILFDAPDFTTSEMWFKFVKLGENDYEYQPIERPECLAGVCNFL